MKNEFAFILKKASSSFGIQILGMGLGYLYGVLVSRNYGAEAFGTLSLMISLLTLVSIISVFGLDRASVKLFAITKAPQLLFKKMILTGFLFSIIVSLIVYVLSGWIATQFYQKPELGPMVQIFSPGIVGLSILAISSESLRGLKKIKSYSFFRLAMVQLLSTSLILFLTPWDIPYAVEFSYVGATLISGICSVLYLRKSVQSDSEPLSEEVQQPKERQQPKESIKSILNLAFPLMLASSFVVMMSQISIFIMVRYVSVLEVGLYAAAFKISMLSSIALKSVNSVTSPQFAALFKEGKFDELKQIVRFSTLLSVLVSIPIILLCVIIPQYILSLYGSEFMVAAYVLQVLALARLVDSAAGPTVVLLQMTDSEKAFRNITFLTLIGLIGLSVYWIPIYGIAGAAYATLASVFMSNSLCLLVIRYKLGFWNFPYARISDMKRVVK